MSTEYMMFSKVMQRGVKGRLVVLPLFGVLFRFVLSALVVISASVSSAINPDEWDCPYAVKVENVLVICVTVNRLVVN